MEEKFVFIFLHPHSQARCYTEGASLESKFWITKSSQAIGPTMKLFLLSFLVLTSLCFVLGDEDEIKPNFDDLNANDGQMFEDTPDDYVEDEEDNVSPVKFICLDWIRAEFIVNWRFVINIFLKNSDFNAREFIMTNCYPHKSCEIASFPGETKLNTHRINCNIHLIVPLMIHRIEYTYSLIK